MDQYKILADDGNGLFGQRLKRLETTVGSYLDIERLTGRTLRYVKIFLSDIANQEDELRRSPLMRDIIGTVPTTVIQQSPVGGAKIALLLKTSDETDTFRFDSLRLQDDEVANFGSYVQTVMLFDKYLALLKEQGLTLKDHCVRTWIYVRDIDTNYDGVVKARNDIFRQHGLTVDTHFIASTGIGGRSLGKNVCVAIDFLTAPGIQPDDILYLKALDHLNPTHEYGVAFERGVRIALPQRHLYFISGTASINNRGEVIHPGDITRQTERLLENIGALLADGGATMNHIKYFVIYLRDLADAKAVDDYMQQTFPETPRIITHANVCRPAWLVEMECVAEKELSS
jgi:enamine deaminase RidA (YjgF/YER057c/UK114 family)